MDYDLCKVSANRAQCKEKMQFYFCIVEVQPNFTEQSDVKLMQAEQNKNADFYFLSRGASYLHGAKRRKVSDELLSKAKKAERRDLLSIAKPTERKGSK